MIEPPRSNDGESCPANEEPCPAGKEPVIDAELPRRIAAGNPQASAVYKVFVHERACRLGQEAQAGRRSTTMERHIRAYRRDDFQMQASLLSVQTALHRRLQDLAQSAEINDDRDSATALISLTSDHCQRGITATGRRVANGGRRVSGRQERPGDNAAFPRVLFLPPSRISVVARRFL